MITTALHAHLDAAPLPGGDPAAGSGEAQQVASSLISMKGVRYGQLVPATTGKHLV